jgi:hypothetical protein
MSRPREAGWEVIFRPDCARRSEAASTGRRTMLGNGESCKGCYYFKQDKPQDEEGHGDCRRYPPQTIPVGGLGRLADKEPVKVKIIVGRTHTTFACGEFREKSDMMRRH